MLEAYNGGVLFGNILRATAREIALLGLNMDTKGDVEKAHLSARGKYLATAFLLRLYMRQYGGLTLLLNKNYAKQQRNYPRILNGIYSLMVAFDPMRETPLAGGRNESLDFGNVVNDFKGTGDGDHGSGGGIRRKLEYWHCGGEHLKSNFPKRVEEKEK